MANEETVEPTTEIKVETETLENDDAQTDEGQATEAEGSEENVEKEEAGSYYEAELKKLQAIEEEKKKLEEELAEKQRQIQIKDRALQAEKKKARQPEALDRDSIKKELLSELRFEAELDRVAKTEAERKLIAHHYANSIVKTDSVSENLKRAVAIANAGRISELLGREQEEGERDERVAASMSGGSYNGHSVKSKVMSPAKKEALAMIKQFKNYSPELQKNLDKYLN